MSALSRRSLLRGACGVALGLPLLETMELHAAPGPKRLLVFFTNNGTVMNAWRPTGTETNFQLASIMQPLAAHQDQLIIMEGIDQESSYNGPGSGDPHMPGMAHLLTGTEMISTGPGVYDRAGGGISVDQHIAQQLNAGTKFGTLSFGVAAREFAASPWNTLSMLGPNMPVDPEDDPAAAFARIFGDIGEDAQVAELRAQRKSVLDVVRQDISALNTRLGAADRARLEQHLDSVREVEKIIDVTVDGCQVPTAPPPVNGSLYADANAPTVMRAQIDLLVSALACDLTRVATLQWREALGGTSTFTWLGQNETHHDISHRTDQTGRDMMVDINIWFAEQLAYLLDQLASVPDGDGTLLDSTAVLWCNELSNGEQHSRRDMPFLLAGSCGGYFNTGRYLQYQGAMHNDLLVSLCNAMDVSTTTFGNPAYCTGPLPNLT